MKPSNEQPIGVVVVGLGRAGRARVRDLQVAEGARLVGTVSRRAGEGSLGLAEALERQDVQAAVIATEDATHAALAERFLLAGKHVAVEFPLAPTAAEARRLLGLARDRGLVLHTELIGLLTRAHADFRAVVQARRPARVELTFTAPLSGWVEAEAQAGRHANLAVGRLHTLWDLVGPLALEHARLHRDPTGYALEATLIPAPGTARGPAGRAHLVERRGAGLPRKRTLVAVFDDGERLEATAEGPDPGLFLRDLAAFLARVRSGGSTGAYVRDADVVGVLGLVDEVRVATGA